MFVYALFGPFGICASTRLFRHQSGDAHRSRPTVVRARAAPITGFSFYIRALVISAYRKRAQDSNLAPSRQRVGGRSFSPPHLFTTAHSAYGGRKCGSAMGSTRPDLQNAQVYDITEGRPSVVSIVSSGSKFSRGGHAFSIKRSSQQPKTTTPVHSR